MYVDDLIITGNNVDHILCLKKKIVDTFEMTNIYLLKLFLGIQVLKMDDGIISSHPKYALDILERVKLNDCKSCV